MTTGFNWDASWLEQTPGSVASPGAEKWKLYPGTDDVWYALDEAGVEHPFIGGAPSFVSVSLTGTGGLGYLQALAQSANPSAPAAAGWRLFGDASGYLSWRQKVGSDTYTRTLNGVLTADRAYTLPDYAGTLATLAGVEILTNKTLTTPTVASFVNATHDHSNAAGGGTLNASAIAAGLLALARGGTNADLSAAGSATAFLAQDGSHVISARAIASADLTSALTTPPAIGGTTPAAGTFTAIAGRTLALAGTTAAPTSAILSTTAYALAAATVSNKALTTNVATLTTSAPHGLSVGWSVMVDGVDNVFNGLAVITAVTSTTFSYALTHADVVSVAATGTATLVQTPLWQVIDPVGTTRARLDSRGYASFGDNAVSSTAVLAAHDTINDPIGTVGGAALTMTVVLSAASGVSISRGLLSNANLNQNGFNDTVAVPGSARGNASNALVIGASGTVTAATAYVAGVTASGGGTLTTGIGFYYPNPTVSGGSTLTTDVGLFMPAHTAATNNIYVLLGTGTPPSGNWGIYSATASDSSMAGKLGLGGNFSPTNTLSLTGQSAQTVWMERQTTSNTAGNSLTAQAGGATSGATDKAGGELLLLPGTSTGTGRTRIRHRRFTTATATGTSDNSAVDAQAIPSTKALTNNTTTGLIDIALPTLTTCGGQMEWSALVTDGTDVQAFSGIMTFAAVNKGGSYTITVTEDTANEAKAVSAGTVTATWTVTSGTNKVTVNVNVNSSLTPSTGYPKLDFIFTNNSEQAPTYL